MKKSLSAVLSVCLVTMMLTGLTGCGKEKATDGFQPQLDTEHSTTLSVVGVFGNFEALETAAVEFQHYYPNIQIEYNSLSNYYEDLKNRFATGEAIDLFCNHWMDYYESMVPDQIDQSFIYENTEDLNSLDLDLSNLDENLLKCATQDGKLYGIPCYVCNNGMAVNMDILKKCGLSLPKSYEEFVTCLEKLQESGYETPLLTYNSTAGYSFTGRYMENIRNGLTPPEAFEQMLDTAQQFYSLGYVHPDSLTLEDDYNSLILRFLEGDIPFAAISSGNYSGIRKREAKSETFGKTPFSYTYCPFPIQEAENTTYMTYLSTFYFSVYKNSENLDYANEFLRFLADDDTMGLMASEKNAPTASTSGMELFPNLRDAKKFYMTPDRDGMRAEEAAMAAFPEYILFDEKQEAAREKFGMYYPADTAVTDGD